MRHIFLAALLAFLPLTAHADDGIQIEAPYARVSGANAASGAVFLTILNHTAADDRLLSVASDVAEKVQLHTHNMTADGVMQMLHVTEGFVIPGMGEHALDRGGDHVMLLGLTRSLAEGDTFALTLTFEKAGDMVIEVPVLNKGPAKAGHEGMDHSGHDQGN